LHLGHHGVFDRPELMQQRVTGNRKAIQHHAPHLAFVAKSTLRPRAAPSHPEKGTASEASGTLVGQRRRFPGAKNGLVAKTKMTKQAIVAENDGGVSDEMPLSNPAKCFAGLRRIELSCWPHSVTLKVL